MNERRKQLLKRFGLAGFLFFLIKGIAWLVVGYMAYQGCN
jgi:hypothetical protein